MTIRVATKAELYCRRTLGAGHHIAPEYRHNPAARQQSDRFGAYGPKITRSRKAVRWWGSVAMKAANALVLCVGILLAAPTGAQQTQDVAPAKAQPAAAAETKDHLLIVSTTEVSEVSDLLADFRTLYPRIETVYSKVNSYEIYNRIVESSPSSEGPGDVVWS